VARDVEALKKLADELPVAHPWPVELTDFAALTEATAHFDRLDVLVHSAGVAGVKPLTETTSRSGEILLRST